MTKPWEEYAKQSSKKPWEEYATAQTESATPLQAGMSAFNRGVRDIVEIAAKPVELLTQDIPQGLGRAIVGQDDPFRDVTGNPSRLYNLITQETISNRQADSEGAKMAERAGYELGASALPALGIFGKAVNTGVRTGQQAIKPIGNAAERFLTEAGNQIRSNPATMAVLEGLGAIGTGIGGYAAERIAPDNQKAETVGQVAGGIAAPLAVYSPTAMALRGTARGVQAIRDLPKVAESRGEKIVRDQLTDSGVARAGAQIEEANRVAGDVGLNLSLAEKAQSPTLLEKQRTLEGGYTGEKLETATQRIAQNEQAVEAYAKKTVAFNGEEPQIVVDNAKKRIDNLTQTIEREATANQKYREGFTDYSLRTANRADVGENIRNALTDAEKTSLKRMSQVADQLGLNDVNNAGNLIPADSFIERLKTDEIIGKSSALAESWYNKNTASLIKDTRLTPDAPIDPNVAFLRQSLGVKAAPSDNLVSFNDFKTLRETVGQEIRAASSMPSRRNEVPQLVRMRQLIDDHLDAHFTNNDKYQQFRDVYFNEHVRPFEQGAAYKVTTKDGQGFYRNYDEQVADTFFKKGGISQIRQFKEIFPDGSMDSAIEQIALDSLRKSAVRDGTLNKGAYDSWMRDYKSVLDEIPALRNKITKIADMDAALVARQQSLTARQKAVNDSLLNKMVQSVDKDARSTDDFIRAALSSPRKLRQVSNATKKNGKESQEALRRAVLKEATQSNNIGEFLENNGDTLVKTGVFTPKHINNLKTLEKAKELVSQLSPTRGAAFDYEFFNKIKRTTGLEPRGIAAAHRNMTRGRSEWRSEAANLGARFFSNRSRIAADKAFEAALYDDDLALRMAQYAEQSFRPSMKDKANKALRDALTRHGAVLSLRTPMLFAGDDDRSEIQGTDDAYSPPRQPLELTITPQNQTLDYQQPIQGGMNKRGIRNNNPGNLRGNDKWLGKIGADDEGFVQFKTPEAGLRALAVNLVTQQKKHGINTVAGLIKKYAPNSENDTVGYIEKVSKDMGVNPNQKVRLTDKKTMLNLMKSIIMMENGSQPYSNAQLMKAINAGIEK